MIGAGLLALGNPIVFLPTEGGTIPHLFLDNVCIGFCFALLATVCAVHALDNLACEVAASLPGRDRGSSYSRDRALLACLARNVSIVVF